MMEDVQETIAKGREFLRANWEQFANVKTDQANGVPVP